VITLTKWLGLQCTIQLAFQDGPLQSQGMKPAPDCLGHKKLDVTVKKKRDKIRMSKQIQENGICIFKIKES
jgi:hypothetical protein